MFRLKNSRACPSWIIKSRILPLLPSVNPYNCDGCKTYLITNENSKSTKISSDCEYHYQNMQYHAAMKPTTQSPCTNVPLNCPICPQAETFWKYTFIIHVVNKHLTDDNNLPFLPIELWATTHISKWEESRMGIPGFKTRECDRLPWGFHGYGSWV